MDQTLQKYEHGSYWGTGDKDNFGISSFGVGQNLLTCVEFSLQELAGGLFQRNLDGLDKRVPQERHPFFPCGLDVLSLSKSRNPARLVCTSTLKLRAYQ